jgi:hypothetical protein
VTDEDHRAGLRRDHTLGDGDVVIERDRRISDNAEAYRCASAAIS